MSNIAGIGDTHWPATHPGYLAFILDTAQLFRCDDFVHIGDGADSHSCSRHPKHPDLPGPKDEWDKVEAMAAEWHRQLKNVKVCEGNHDLRVYNAAASVNIPKRLIRGYNERYGTPTWKWAHSWEIDGVYYFHGTGHSGKHPACNVMEKMCMSVVMGHIHTASGVSWKVNPNARMFGMDLGSGVDDYHLAMEYGINFKLKSILSMGVVRDGDPLHIIMPCGPGEKYHKSRFKKGGWRGVRASKRKLR